MLTMEYFKDRPLEIGKTRQLLLDDLIIEDGWKLKRVLHQPVKWFKNPVIYKTEPWEAEAVGHPTVFYDADYGCYRMWYISYSLTNYYRRGPTDVIHFMCYAESKDGLHWTKPLLDVCDFPGFEKTNVVYCGANKLTARGQVFKDETEKDPEKRYKMICLEIFPWEKGAGGRCSGLRLLYSPDGLKWNSENSYFVLDYHSDTNNHIVFDEKNHRWLLFCRPTMYCSGRSSNLRHHRRRVSVMISQDLINWSYPRTVLFPDEMDLPDYDHVYVVAYQNYFLMFYTVMDGDTHGRKETRFAWSKDGFHWDRFYTRQAFLPRGNQDFWDAGAVLTYAMVEQGEDLVFYYTGSQIGQHEYGIHRNGIGAAFLKKDRFIEQRAEDEVGYLLTREFICPARCLRLNTGYWSIPNKQQYIKVEVVRRPNTGEHAFFSYPYPGYSFEESIPISTDRTDVFVMWKTKKDLSELAGKPIYLRFELMNMGLFSFYFTD
ncbi:MAG: hypothetical protein NC937_05730 [Candidatus Omnitrophica bacterium]|nr:hypothetical protein [Candidatus Omnitrophota bacterium]MCM8825619.1 hypothetical protein [Candidatus Omnitrophota bacterium]MCM8827670.1 hypothetical protein [Candidatus Omnitrophota bacterium]